MRKGLGILFLLIAVVHVLSAQRDRGQLAVGAAFTRFSIEDLSTLSVYGEFTKTFAGPIVLGFGGSYAQLDEADSLAAPRTLKSFDIALQAYYAILRDERQQLLAGAGVSGRYFNDQWLLDPELFTQKGAFKPGFVLIVKYNVALGDQWLLGGRASLQAYEKNNSTYLLGGHIAYKF